MSQVLTAQRKDVVKWLAATAFSGNSHKYKRGHALVVAGSNSYSGAAVLAGNAAMRSGVGMVTLCVPESCRSEVASRTIPEVIVRGMRIDADVYGENANLLQSADAIAVGCGLDAEDGEVSRLVFEIITARKVPVVVDASALTVVAASRSDAEPLIPILSMDENARVQPPLVFTPHDGEFLRLLGTDDRSALDNRVQAVRDFSQQNKVILVLKGERTLIGNPDGRVVENPTGNSGLGKAGNGDTLTGIIIGFIAQAERMGIDIFETVVAAVYVAGCAGDLAKDQYGKRVMTASDVRDSLAEVFRELEASSV